MEDATYHVVANVAADLAWGVHRERLDRDRRHERARRARGQRSHFEAAAGIFRCRGFHCSRAERVRGEVVRGGPLRMRQCVFSGGGAVEAEVGGQLGDGVGI